MGLEKLGCRTSDQLIGVPFLLNGCSILTDSGILELMFLLILNSAVEAESIHFSNLSLVSPSGC